MSSAHRTTDHQTIHDWVQARGGKPAHVAGTGRKGSETGVLRIDFPGYSGGDSLEPLDWDTWFDAFEANKLAFLFQDKTADGQQSRFNKLVHRTAEDEAHPAPPHQRGQRRKGRTTQVDLETAGKDA